MMCFLVLERSVGGWILRFILNMRQYFLFIFIFIQVGTDEVGLGGRILSITPDAIFLVLCLARIWYLMRKPVVLARAGYLHFGGKCLAGGLVVVSLAATIGILSARDTGLPRITVVSAGLSLASSVSLLDWGLPHIFRC